MLATNRFLMVVGFCFAFVAVAARLAQKPTHVAYTS